MVPCGTTSNGKGSKPMMFNIHGWREVHASAFFKEKYIGTHRNYCNIQDLVSAEKHATETSIFDWYCNLQISPGRFPQVNVSGLSMVHSCAAGRRAVSLAIEASKPNFSDGSRYPEMPGSWELIDGLAARWSPNPLAEVVTRLSLVGRWAEWRWLDHLQLWRILLSESTTVGTIWQWNISYKPPWLVRGFYFAVFAGKYFSFFLKGIHPPWGLLSRFFLVTLLPSPAVLIVWTGGWPMWPCSMNAQLLRLQRCRNSHVEKLFFSRWF